MRCVKQTIFDTTNGNCFAACLASLLDCELEQVPQCIAADDWWDQYQAFVARHGYQLFHYSAEGNPPLDGHAILGGLTPSGALHCVVTLDGELLWDPLGSETGPGVVKPMTWVGFQRLDTPPSVEE